jgi:hypothetical protein
MGRTHHPRPPACTGACTPPTTKHAPPCASPAAPTDHRVAALPIETPLRRRARESNLVSLSSRDDPVLEEYLHLIHQGAQLIDRAAERKRQVRAETRCGRRPAARALGLVRVAVWSAGAAHGPGFPACAFAVPG